MKLLFIENLFRKYSDRFISHWIVLLYDMTVVFVTFFLANFMRYNFTVSSANLLSITLQSFIVLLVYLFSFFVTKSYRSIIRHSGINDSLRILKATGSSCLVLTFIYLLTSYFNRSTRFIPSVSIIIINFLLAQLFLVWSRFLIKSFYFDFINKDARKPMRVLIYGAGSAGMQTRNALRGDSVYRYEVIAFIDDNESKVNKMIEGTPVISVDKGMDEEYVKQNNIRLLILAIPGLKTNQKNQIIDHGLDLGLKVKVVPSINTWINGQLSSNQLSEVKIEELLGRETISLQNDNLIREIRDKIIMVTGAAGSIGSEIVRQVLQYQPIRVILVDQAESDLYDLQNEINSSRSIYGNYKSVIYIVANVKDRFRMNQVFEIYKPQFVFHAAAYKHVPLMEENPYEALMVNVFGTKVIADLSLKYKVHKFVMVSTDKAVNPTNVMGASKRLAEIYIQSLSTNLTHFITTRFGNVLGSNGSVIPLFRKQIEQGGPVTVTHKEITRYFMTIPEACNLVLEAGVMGKGGEILIFDMGKSIRIYDLARKMIQLSGFTPDIDIFISEIGLRPGEKLKEELLAKEEQSLPTYHPKIMKAKVRQYEKKDVSRYMDELSQLVLEEDIFAIIYKLKEFIPEYISNNSVYCSLDQKK